MKLKRKSRYNDYDLSQLTARHLRTLLRNRRYAKGLRHKIVTYCDTCDTKQYCRRQQSGHKRCEIIARAMAQKLQ